MNFITLKERARHCIEKHVCFISLKKLSDENLVHVYNSEVGLEVPINKKFV